MKRAFQRLGTPLAFYYAVTLGLPLANGAAGSEFREHALVVLAIPPGLILLFCAMRAVVVLPFRSTALRLAARKHWVPVRAPVANARR